MNDNFTELPQGDMPNYGNFLMFSGISRKPFDEHRLCKYFNHTSDIIFYSYSTECTFTYCKCNIMLSGKISNRLNNPEDIQISRLNIQTFISFNIILLNMFSNIFF